jgi:hypothetical protein
MKKIILNLLVFAGLTAFSQSTPISGLPSATTITGTEIAPIVQGGVTKKVILINIPITGKIATTPSTALTGSGTAASPYTINVASGSTPTLQAGLLAIGDGTNALTSNILLAFVSNTLTSPSFSATGRSDFGSLTLSTPLNSVYISEASYWSGKQNALTFSTSITASNVVAATFSASGTSTLNNLVVPIGKTITGRKIRQEGTGSSFSAGSLLFSELGADFVASPSLTSNVTTITIAGTPYNGQLLELQLTDNGTARTLAWPSGSFYGSLLPTITVPTKTTFVFLQWRGSVSKWLCVGSLTE